MIIRIRYEIAGGHVHCRMFTAKSDRHTFEKNGDLVFRKGNEFKEFYQNLDAEFIAEGDEEESRAKLREAFEE